MISDKIFESIKIVFIRRSFVDMGVASPKNFKYYVRILKIFGFLKSAFQAAQQCPKPLFSISLFLDSATRNAQKRFPTLSSISLFKEKEGASYIIE